MTGDDVPRALLDLGTAAVSDALDRLGLPGACLGVLPVDPSFRMAGPARTVRYGPVGRVKGTVGDFVDDVAPGAVVVLDNSGRLDATVWGDIMTELAHRNGIAGTVIDGVCRDTALCTELGYPVFSRGRHMRTGKDRVQVEGIDVPVTVGGVRVAPDDLLVGDRDGVVVVPGTAASEVLAVAREIDEVEQRIREAVRAGSSLREARAGLGYHGLQTARPVSTGGDRG